MSYVRFLCRMDYASRRTLFDDEESSTTADDSVAFNVWTRVRRGVVPHDPHVSTETAQFVAAVFDRVTTACRDADVQFCAESPSLVVDRCCLLRCTMFGTVIGHCDLRQREIRFRETERLLLRPAYVGVAVDVAGIRKFRVSCRYESTADETLRLVLEAAWPAAPVSHRADYGLYLTADAEAASSRPGAWLEDKYERVYQIETRVWRWLSLRKRFAGSTLDVDTAYDRWRVECDAAEFVLMANHIRDMFSHSTFERVSRYLASQVAATIPGEPIVPLVDLVALLDRLRPDSSQFYADVFRLRQARLLDFRAMQQVRAVPEHFLPLYTIGDRLLLVCVEIRHRCYAVRTTFSRRRICSPQDDPCTTTVVSLSTPIEWMRDSSRRRRRRLFAIRRSSNDDDDAVSGAVLTMRDAKVTKRKGASTLPSRHTLRFEDGRYRLTLSGPGVPDIAAAARRATTLATVQDDNNDQALRPPQPPQVRESTTRLDRMFDDLMMVHRYLTTHAGLGVPGMDRLERTVSQSRLGRDDNNNNNNEGPFRTITNQLRECFEGLCRLLERVSPRVAHDVAELLRSS